VLIACETPVYRYAMYRWQPAPYEVYYFHDQPAGEQDQRVADLLAELSEGSDNRANVAYIPVNLAEDQDLASVPPDVKKAWDAREDKSLPAHFISTPFGVGLSFEQLDEKTTQALVESPARTSLAAQLETGKVGVFVMLTGKEEAENEEAATILNGLVEEVREGNISLYVSPTQEAVAQEGEETEGEETEPSFDLGLIKLDRDNEEERWFVRSLLAMEAELTEEERPMVFLCYGRARALLPYIGAGITRENLVREIEFVSGACSCTVKEQNPGVDLLVRYDWESAAATLADKFGSEEGNESQAGPEVFFPELIIPTGEAAADGELASAEVDQGVVEEPSEQEGDAEATPEVVEVAATDPEAGVETTEVPKGQEVASVPASKMPDEFYTASSDASSLKSVWIVGAGIGIALVVLFSLTFVVLRPR
jgi:hypothetical protein